MKLNNYIRKLALEGKNATKTVNKCAKFDCSKDISKGGTLACVFCQRLTHKNCISTSAIVESKFRCESCLIKDVKTVQSTELVENENILKLSLISDLSININPKIPELETQSNQPCALCKELLKSNSELNNHITQKHKYSCDICKETLTDEKSLKAHVDSHHEARKRLRSDTSLIEVDNDCLSCVCEDKRKQNETLKHDLHEAQNINLENKHLLIFK